MKKILVLSLLFSSAASGQPFQRTATPNDTLQSVRMLPGNGVVLSIYAPKASEVLVSGDFPGGFPSKKLSKHENGIWSLAIDSITPDVYTYDFTVDGVKTFDPKNPHYKESENGFSNIFEIPGREID